MVNINRVLKEDDLNIIEDLAKTIWHEHYTKIIGSEQVNYMLEKYQSKHVMKKQIQDLYQYYLVSFNTISCGYYCVKVDEDQLFLSKIYLLKEYRSKGIGKKMMDSIISIAKKQKVSKIKLTVNKYNSNSIKAYEKMGFKNVNSIVQDIGNGYVMDDYVLELYL